MTQCHHLKRSLHIMCKCKFSEVYTHLLVLSSIEQSLEKKSLIEMDSSLAVLICPKIVSYEGGGSIAYNITSN